MTQKTNPQNSEPSKTTHGNYEEVCLYRERWGGADASTLKEMYAAYVRPAMDYGIVAWAFAGQTNFNKMNTTNISQRKKKERAADFNRNCTDILHQPAQ